MDADKANTLRLTAAEIIRQLWEAGETEALTLLRDQAAVSIEKPFRDDVIRDSEQLEPLFMNRRNPEDDLDPC